MLFLLVGGNMQDAHLVFEQLETVHAYYTAHIRTFVQFDPVLKAYVANRDNKTYREQAITLNIMWFIYQDTRKLIISTIDEECQYDGYGGEVILTDYLHNALGSMKYNQTIPTEE